MKAKPLKQDGNTYRPCEPAEATHVKLNVPGPYPYRILPVVMGNTTRAGTPCWTWNGSTEKPTFKPSVLTEGGDGRPRCHSFITDGKIQFLNDCTHELAGKTVDLLEVD